MSEVWHEADRSAFMRKWEKFVRGERLRLNLMMLPGVVFVFLFNMMTLLGIAVAFQDFIPRRGWFGSDWVGLRNFRLFFEMPNAYTILRNTLVIAIGKIVLTLIVAVLLMNFFKSVPIDMNESATVDGASPLTILVRIYLPVSLPALATVGLFCFVSHWNSWYDGLVLINKSALMPLMCIYPFLQKYFVSGLTLGAVKE